jgi:N-methylhydantoinase A/oxoprolinase/acetone carboxylase beta subunit
MEQIGATPAAICELSHGFTVATNAILEEKGAAYGAHYYGRLP